MPFIVANTEKIIVNYSRSEVLPIIQNIRNIEQYEPKVIGVRVQPLTDSTGFYFAHGFFALLPWRGKFSYTLTDSGFTSVLLESPFANLQVNGGFTVTALSDSDNQCKILHYEKYTLPSWLCLFQPLISAYVKWSMKRELNNLARIIASQLDIVSSVNPSLVQDDATRDDNEIKHYTTLNELNSVSEGLRSSSAYNFEPITFLSKKGQKNIPNDHRQRKKSEDLTLLNSETASGTQKLYKHNKQS